MTHAYRVPVLGGRPDATEGWRSRAARGRPNWWVILAVSLGLMALLVATAGGTPRATRRGGSARAASRVALTPGAQRRAGTKGGSLSVTATTTTTTTPTITAAPPSSGPADGGTALISTGVPRVVSTPQPAATSVTTTTQAPPATTTTTTTEPGAVPADRTQGYLDPPSETSNKYGFTGTGAMEISVVWSGDTYLTMEVSCANGSQNVGGTSAMAASLPDATGSCLATVSEPAPETTSLTYTISIGPAGG